MKGGHLQVHHSLITSTKKARLAHEFRADAAACMGLWLEASLYASGQLTDGKVPVPVLYSMADPEHAQRLIGILVEVELFARVSDYEVEIVGYLERNRSREQVEAISEKRKNAGTLGGKVSKPKAKPKQNKSKAKAKAKPPVSVSVSVSEVVSVSDQGESEGASGAVAERVFGEWRAGFSKPDTTRLTKSRRAKVLARLKSFTADQLCEAVRNAAADPWRHEEPVRHELATLLRSDEHVENHLQSKPKLRAVGSDPATWGDRDRYESTPIEELFG